MFSTEEVVDLIKAHKSGSDELFDREIQKLANKSEEKGKKGVAKALRDIYSKPNDMFRRISQESVKQLDSPRKSPSRQSTKALVSKVVLSKRNSIIIDEVIQTWTNRQRLSQENIDVNARIMLYGLPGTGKTYLANAIANTLNLPIAYVDISKVISSYLGETGKNVDQLFEGRKNEVLFLDEFDALAKNRSDEMDIGEAKRIVTAILQNLDRLSDDVLVIAATNHMEMIDTAIRRRFSYELNMNDIDIESRKKLYGIYLADHNKVDDGFVELLAKNSEGFTGHDIHRIYSKAIKRSVLQLDKLTFQEQLLRQVAETKYRKKEFNSKDKGDVKELRQLVSTLWEQNKKFFTYEMLENITGIPDATIHYIINKGATA